MKGKIDPSRKDQCDIYGVLYETDDNVQFLDGTNSLTSPNIVALARDRSKLPETDEWKDFNFCTGSIIGSVKIVDCVQNHSSIWAEKGVYNWVLKDAILFDKPISNVKGKLSFWDYPYCGIEER